MTFIDFRPWQIHDASGRRKYLSSDERPRFLAAADKSAPGPKALCYLLAYSGCRVSEALNLRSHQIDRSEGVVVLCTLKRRKLVFRTVPIPAFLLEMLAELVPNEDGKLWAIHRSTAWRYVKRALADARVAGPMACCRGLRHGFGIRAAGRNVPPSIIQKWMGHASLETTSIYIDAVGEEERSFAARTWQD